MNTGEISVGLPATDEVSSGSEKSLFANIDGAGSAVAVQNPTSM